MRRYETIFIVRPNTGEDDVTGLTDKVSAIIAADSGTVIKIDRWGLRKLAYAIGKETQGYYVYCDYAAIPAAVTEIERILKIDDRILKFMTVKLSDTFDPAALEAEEAEKAAAAAAAHDAEEGDAEEGDVALPEEMTDDEQSGDRDE